jgi:hypothetical protein
MWSASYVMNRPDSRINSSEKPAKNIVKELSCQGAKRALGRLLTIDED